MEFGARTGLETRVYQDINWFDTHSFSSLKFGDMVCGKGFYASRGVLTVNQRVAGSSPAGGANFPEENQRVSDPLGALVSSFLGDW